MTSIILVLTLVFSLNAENEQKNICDMDKDAAQKILDFETTAAHLLDIQIEEYCDL